MTRPAAKARPTKPAAKPKAKPADPAAVDAWLARLPDDQRAALERLRAQIRRAAVGVIETVAWNVPMYYLGTTPLLGFNAFKHHVSLGIGSETIDALRDALAGYDLAKDTIRFTPDRPLPAALVTRLVKTRLAVHAGKRA